MIENTKDWRGKKTVIMVMKMAKERNRIL